MREKNTHTSHVGTALVMIVVGFVLVCALWIFAGLSAHQAKEQGAVSVRQAVFSSAMQCFAIEGAYPANLAYLEDNYGLSINHDDYVVTYDAFASNVLPSVVVKVK